MGESDDVKPEREAAPDGPAGYSVGRGGRRDEINQKTAEAHQHRSKGDALVDGIIKDDREGQQESQVASDFAEPEQTYESYEEEREAPLPDGLQGDCARGN